VTSDSAELESERCTLRRPTPADAGPIAEAVSDDRFPKNDSWRFVESAADAADRIRTQLTLWQEDRALHFSIVLKASSEFAGQVSLSREPEPGTWQLGYWVTPHRWGQGLASEAAAAVLGFAFSELEAETLWAGAAPENRASLRVIEKLGFRFQRENPRGYALAEGWLAMREYVLQRSIWRGSHSAPPG
jgi:ribosomal-protein-alanine N-acetyltransferase